MATEKIPTDQRVTAEELARALRSGLELRWSMPAPAAGDADAFPPQGRVRPFLEPFAEAVDFPLPRGRHPLHRLLRGLWAVLRKLSAPWLQRQTHFNRRSVSALEHLAERVRELEQSEQALRRRLAELGKMPEKR